MAMNLVVMEFRGYHGMRIQAQLPGNAGNILNSERRQAFGVTIQFQRILRVVCLCPNIK